MKKPELRLRSIIPGFFAVIAFLLSLSPARAAERPASSPAAEQELRRYVDSLPFFDSHSHAAGFDLGTPKDDKQGKSLPQILMNDYLAYMADSCADVPEPPKDKPWGIDNARDHFQAFLPLLDLYRAQTTYEVLREGIRELHPFSEEDITLQNFDAINRHVVNAYRKYGEREWHRRACRRAGICKTNQMTFLPYVIDHLDGLSPEERQMQLDLLAPSLILDGYIFSGFVSNKAALARSKELVGMDPKNYTEYLQFCEKALDLFVSKGGVSVKILVAYMRPLKFQEVPDAVAAPLFARGADKLTPAELTALQDNLMWHLLEMANKRKLPVIVHAGYAWPTQYGDAEQMLDLIRSPRLPGMKLGICHSNWPSYGSALIMARTYRGVCYDMSWTPTLSYDLGKRILSEAVDLLPRNKILIGTDAGSAESMLGTSRLIRRIIFEVLAQKMQEGHFGLPVAKAWAKGILLDNALEFYGMKPDDPRLPLLQEMLKKDAAGRKEK
jgi:predicted TIM-barrel fold metal-dependent hydrolase